MARNHSEWPVLRIIVGILFWTPIAVMGEESAEPEVEFPGSFPVGDSGVYMKVGGQLRLDMIHDFRAMGSTDVFDPSTIPTDGTEGENTVLHARGSRLYLDARGASGSGILRGYFEGDFFGTESSFRIRHSYGEFKEFLAGKTWTTFMDDKAIPGTLDADHPRTMIFNRVAMLRWTHPLSSRNQVALALEDPGGVVLTPSDYSGSTETPWPSLVGRGRMTGGWGHGQITGFLGGIRYRDDSGRTADDPLWGLSASGLVRIAGRDDLILQIAYGDGVGQFRGGAVAAINESGEFQVIRNGSATAAFRHHWSEVFTSNWVANYGWNEKLEGGRPTDPKATWYGAFNVIWTLTPRAQIGAEWLYGQREDQGGSMGHNNRLQIQTSVFVP